MTTININVVLFELSLKQIFRFFFSFFFCPEDPSLNQVSCNKQTNKQNEKCASDSLLYLSLFKTHYHSLFIRNNVLVLIYISFPNYALLQTQHYLSIQPIIFIICHQIVVAFF